MRKIKALPLATMLCHGSMPAVNKLGPTNKSVYMGRLIRTERMCRCRTIQRMVSLLFLAENGQLGEKWQRMA